MKKRCFLLLALLLIIGVIIPTKAFCSIPENNKVEKEMLDKINSIINTVNQDQLEKHIENLQEVKKSLENEKKSLQKYGPTPLTDIAIQNTKDQIRKLEGFLDFGRSFDQSTGVLNFAFASSEYIDDIKNGKGYFNSIGNLISSGTQTYASFVSNIKFAGPLIIISEGYSIFDSAMKILDGRLDLSNTYVSQFSTLTNQYFLQYQNLIKQGYEDGFNNKTISQSELEKILKANQSERFELQRHFIDLQGEIMQPKLVLIFDLTAQDQNELLKHIDIFIRDLGSPEVIERQQNIYHRYHQMGMEKRAELDRYRSYELEAEAFYNDIIRKISGDQIAFSKTKMERNSEAHVDLGSEIYLMNEDGQNIRKFNVDGTVRYISWSPDKSKLAYMAGDGLCVLNFNTGKIQTVAQGDIGRIFDWSPDGTKIVYTKFNHYDVLSDNRFDEANIYVVDLTTRKHSKLTTNPSKGGLHPTWSPDGKKIAFAGVNTPVKLYSPFNMKLMIMDADGSNIRDLGCGGGRPRWSPDGKKIAFYTEGVLENNYEADLCLINADGTGLKTLVKGERFENDDLPQWSPDGTKIIYVVDPPESKEWRPVEWFIREIRVLDINSNQSITLTNDYSNSAVWSPDGNKILYCSLIEYPRGISFLPEHGISIMNADGTEKKTLIKSEYNIGCDNLAW